MAKVDPAHEISAVGPLLFNLARCDREPSKITGVVRLRPSRNLLVAPKEGIWRVSENPESLLREAGLVEHTCPSTVVGHFFMRDLT